MSHDPYIGSGIVYIEDVDGTDGMIDVGNSIELTKTPNLASAEQKNYRSSSGGLYAEVKRNEGDEVSFTVGGVRHDNLAKASNGDITIIASGTVTDETVTSKLDRFLPLTKLPDSVSDVNDAAAGLGTSFIENTDYIVRAGGLFIPSGSNIPADTTLYVTYTNKASKRIEGALNTGKNYRIYFAGENVANQESLIIDMYKVPLNNTGGVSFIGDDFATLKFTGKLLPDLTKNGTTESQYYYINAE